MVFLLQAAFFSVYSLSEWVCRHGNKTSDVAMMVLLRIVLALLFCECPVKAQQFLYPVAGCEDGRSLYLIHQRSPEALDLLKWDPKTKRILPMLLPSYTPARIKLLPDGSGFSFNDKGRIRIKKSNKRSPKTIEFYAPLDEITQIAWADDKSFYFMGKSAKNYGIIHADLQGSFTILVAEHGVDYLYPQKEGDTLFFVRRDAHGCYALMSTDYPLINHLPIDDSLTTDDMRQEKLLELLEAERTRKPIVEQEKIEKLYEAGQGPISFLKMISKECGFYVKHPAAINRSCLTVAFDYCEIKKEDKEWRTRTLFSFSLPAKLFLGALEERLYESLSPLLPQHVHGSCATSDIFYVSCVDGEQTGVFCYNVATKSSQPISARAPAQGVPVSFFAPIIIKGPACKNDDYCVYYGGELTYVEGPREDPRSSTEGVAMWTDDKGFLYASLPKVFIDR